MLLTPFHTFAVLIITTFQLIAGFYPHRYVSPNATQLPIEGDGPAADGFDYKFENARFYISLIELKLDPEGMGTLRFKQGESDDVIDQKVNLQRNTLQKINELLAKANFLGSTEDYQSKKDFSHLGWITIAVASQGKHRSVRFNYTQVKAMADLADLFRAIATQGIDLFHLRVSLEHQPLDVPAQVDAIENDLRLERLAEPQSLIGPLRDLAQDDTVPLIARNHAGRLITEIQKGKFKSPVADK